MRKILTVTFISLISLTCFAQEWQNNLDKAKQIATENSTSIVIVFQGSDWCAPCIKLDREIWSTKAFQDLAKDHFVMLKADFPKRKKNKLSIEQQEHNNALAEKYNPNGYFPYVVVLDAKGKALGSLGYEKTIPESFFNKLTAFEN
ncbi:thioredoxin family protein [Lacinutrix sp. Bg11-31]|uniref:thioredoxin family protein n=1 Tax=Lacinutrix sp. Bg11-31 TaxID=2057808 RepID=UPI000C306C9A|nr:thioredoxin family protein [Lacinutrix sp. Bg11-31]AUC81541.1 thioredoxin family protein [Lacinutrix sp. Bg11-31]